MLHSYRSTKGKSRNSLKMKCVKKNFPEKNCLQALVKIVFQAQQGKAHDDDNTTTSLLKIIRLVSQWGGQS